MTKKSVFQLNYFEYFADFLIVPVCLMAIMHYNTWPIWLMVLVVGGGAVSWTLYEYLLHRYVLHGHGTFGSQHKEHHQRPKALVGNPPWMTLAFTLFLLAFTWIVTNYNLASAYTAGVLLGYLIYAVIHVNLHHQAHGNFGRIMAYLYEHHQGHHRGGRCNYGVTTDIWDRILRTKRHAKKA